MNFDPLGVKDGIEPTIQYSVHMIGFSKYKDSIQQSKYEIINIIFKVYCCSKLLDFRGVNWS